MLMREPPGNQPSAAIGAITGLWLTAPLLAVWYLAYVLAALPFVPFDLFDGLARVLPGGVLTLGIDLLVRVVRASHVDSTASAAKTAEQTLALTLVLLVGVLAGAVVFSVARGAKRTARAPALIAAALIGAGGWLVTLALHSRAGAGLFIAAVWIGATMTVWGCAVAWIHARLQGGPEGVMSAQTANDRAIDRRRFLVEVGGAMAATTIAGVTVGARVGARRGSASGRRWSSHHTLPNASDAVMPVEGTRSELTSIDDHYRIDIDTVPPVIRDVDWRLKVSGLVDHPVQWSLEDIRQRTPMHQFITLSCISNPVGGDLIGTTRWTGVSLGSLLSEWGVTSRATHLRIRSADGFYEVVSVDLIRQDERVMLTYAWDDVPLPVAHGFPLRIYVPNVYGMKQPKWIQSIEAIDRWEPGYWVARGWDRDAMMKATSVIDTARASGRNMDGARTLIAGGIAHAGVRGISRVDLQIDGGVWHESQLRAPMSGTTWRIWKAELPIEAGNHELTVRCVDGQGAPQLTTVAPPHPSGASGLYRKVITV
jgi:DMSO/TMAO reductase YedYZ molybdopterin-dependent catalytic subunit